MKSKKVLYLKINCLVAPVCVCGISLFIMRVTHLCMLSIYTFEETSLTIGYIPSPSFSSAPSVKIPVDSMKGAGESLDTGC